jgi:UDP-N-acetylmuramoylalanine--D-glutamate ligase
MAAFDTRAGFAGSTALVLGARVAGRSAARALVTLGASVQVADRGPEPELGQLPDPVRFVGDLATVPSGVDVVITSPGLRPDHPVLTAAATAGVPVLGELEFAWRIRGEHPAPWLMITGTNGKTTTVRMLEAILLAAGRRARAVGNVGVPVIDAVLADPPYEVLAVEASSFQLFYSQSLGAHAGALLNLAPDHLDWHGSMDAYRSAKLKVWRAGTAIGNADDAMVSAALTDCPVPRRVSFTLAEPGPGQYGVRAGDLVDGEGHSLVAAREVRPAGRHNVANALAAAALAATVGVSPAAVADGLRSFVPDPHRNQVVARRAGVTWVDDSKATNPHAAAASLQDYDSVVWVAGGQLKDAPVDELVARFARRMRGVVLLGVDRPVIAAALARHAPDLPVMSVSRTDDEAMYDVVRAAASLAHAGDTVLLAPAAASWDMFADYGERGDAFAAAVAALDPEET